MKRISALNSIIGCLFFAVFGIITVPILENDITVCIVLMMFSLAELLDAIAKIRHNIQVLSAEKASVEMAERI